MVSVMFFKKDRVTTNTAIVVICKGYRISVYCIIHGMSLVASIDYKRVMTI